MTSTNISLYAKPFYIPCGSGKYEYVSYITVLVGLIIIYDESISLQSNVYLLSGLKSSQFLRLHSFVVNSR